VDEEKWIRRIERERRARKEAEKLLEDKSLELWELNRSLEKKVDERTDDLQAALKQAENANIAKDVFLSNMSHEIRTPLNAIIGFVDVMLIQELQKEKQQKYLKIIKQSGSNLLSIINDILDFSKIQSGKFSINRTSVNLKQSLSHNIELFNAKAQEKSIEYEVFFEDTFPPSLIADETRIIQVMNNFISNAIKFTPEKGHVSVNLSYDQSRSMFGLRVRDSGIGISEEAQKKIFTPFEQEDVSTTKEYGGTGLGLPISLSLIEMMEGHVIFESKKGEGSTFGFEIPLAQSLKEEEHFRDSKDESSRLIGHLLVAVANKRKIALIALLLDNYGLSFDNVTNAQEALDALNNTSYDLVLMDEDISAIELTKQMRVFHQTLPIAVFSAKVSPEDQASLIDSGVNNILLKPIDADGLTELLYDYLRKDTEGAD
jgi:signal transduction histidine kinase